MILVGHFVLGNSDLHTQAELFNFPFRFLTNDYCHRAVTNPSSLWTDSAKLISNLSDCLKSYWKSFEFWLLFLIFLSLPLPSSHFPSSFFAIIFYIILFRFLLCFIFSLLLFHWFWFFEDSVRGLSYQKTFFFVSIQ